MSGFFKISWLPACHRKVSMRSVRFLQQYHGSPPATGWVACGLSGFCKNIMFPRPCHRECIACGLPVFAKKSWLHACHKKGSMWVVSFCKTIMASRLPQEGYNMWSVIFCKNILAPRLPQEGYNMWSVIFCKISWLPACHRKGITCGLSVFAKISWLPPFHRNGITCGLSGFCKNIMAPRLPQEKFSKRFARFFAKLSWLPACHRKSIACGLSVFAKFHGFPPDTGRV